MDEAIETGLSVQVRYYAILREQRGAADERVTTTARTARELYDRLRAKHGFTLEARHLRVAVNEEFAEWETELREGDQLVFIPPVAGG